MSATPTPGAPASVPAAGAGPAAELAPAFPTPPSSVSEPEPPLLPGLEWLWTPARISYLILAIFVAIGAYLRLNGLGTGSLWVDESQSTIFAFSILQRGYPIIATRYLLNNWEPLYSYLEAGSIQLLGRSNFAYRLPAAIVGIVLIPVAFTIGKRYRDQYVGIAFAAMVTFSTEYIAWSRTARWYTLLVLMMALGFLCALLWYRSRERRTRILCVAGMVGFAALSAVTSIGLFLLYTPGILLGGVVYLFAANWDAVLRFFGRRAGLAAGASLPPARLVPYRFRFEIFLLLLVALVVGVVVEFHALEHLYTVEMTRLLGMPPYPLTWSGNLGTYLVDFYPGILFFAALAALLLVVRHDPFDLALVAFCIGAFISVSIGASITNPIAAGGASYIRHLLPLEFFLFLLASLALIEILRRLYHAVVPAARRSFRLHTAMPAIVGVAIVVLLVVPGAVVPSSLTLYSRATQSPADSLVPWYAFSVDPQYPSALYGVLQANYQLASDYVVAHRSPGDVVAATNCGPPAVYIGSVQYWVRSNPLVTAIIYVHGRPAFQYTNSLLVDNTSQFESLLYNSSGWMISDAPTTATVVFADGMNDVLTYFMTKIDAGSDVSILLFHWNQSTPIGVLEMLESRVPALHVFDSNVSQLAAWATTGGVTQSSFRDLLIPIAPLVFSYVPSQLLPIAVLLNVYNHRPDLQAEFPQVLGTTSNRTALIHWAAEVVTGVISDPAESVLAPYASWYEANG